MTYIELFASHTERRKILQQKFGFLCCCPACTADGTELHASDERRERLALLDRQIRDDQEKHPEKSMEGEFRAPHI